MEFFQFLDDQRSEDQADDQAGIELAVRFAAGLRACGDETPVTAGSVREHRLELV